MPQGIRRREQQNIFCKNYPLNSLKGRKMDAKIAVALLIVATLLLLVNYFSSVPAILPLLLHFHDVRGDILRVFAAQWHVRHRGMGHEQKRTDHVRGDVLPRGNGCE